MAQHPGGLQGSSKQGIPQAHKPVRGRSGRLARWGGWLRLSRAPATMFLAADEVDEGEGEGELDAASSVEVDPVVDVDEQALERVITKLAPAFSVFRPVSGAGGGDYLLSFY